MSRDLCRGPDDNWGQRGMERRGFLQALAGIILWATGERPFTPVARGQSTVATRIVLVDDFAPQPLQGEPFWSYNRLGGDRGEIHGPGRVEVLWRQGAVRAGIIGGAGTFVGTFTTLNHLIREQLPLNFSAIFPAQIIPKLQGRVTRLRIHVLNGQGTLRVELKAPGHPTPVWQASVALSGGSSRLLSFNLPSLGAVHTLNWLVIGDAGAFAQVAKIELEVEVPSLPPQEQAFLWSYAQLLENFTPASGLTRDRANFPAGDFDNVSASGMQAAAAVMAGELGMISPASAHDIVERTTQGLLALPQCKGVWPHFVGNGQIKPQSEWSSIDTIIALLALLEARQALGLATAAVEAVLTGINWAALMLPDGSISHGYDDQCNRLGHGWSDFGTESWLANLGYAMGTGKVAYMEKTAPTFNGSGFIDELAWLLVPAPMEDCWGIRWLDYRGAAAANHLAYYGGNSPSCPYSRAPYGCYAQAGLFGLSAAEVPEPSLVPTQIYQAFGVGGKTPPHDGRTLPGGVPFLSSPVIIPHYAGMIASVRPAEATVMWRKLQDMGLLTPLNNVESLMINEACNQVVWNTLKGSWNLSLQALGWGQCLLGGRNPLYRAVSTNPRLSQAYYTMSKGSQGCVAPK